MAGSTLLRLDHVGVRYGRRGRLVRHGRSERWALRDVCFELRAGEALGVVGRNGAGKTTLLRVLAGIFAPDRGSVVRFHRGRASLLSLQVGFLSHLTGRENAILGGMLLGMSYWQMTGRLADIVEFSGLGAAIDDPIATYSDGMRARLGFSVAFLTDAEIVLVDEVLGTGDEAFFKKSSDAMRDLLRSDRTVVLVSHDATTIESLCDRAVLIEAGESAAEGDPASVLARYRSGAGRAT